MSFVYSFVISQRHKGIESASELIFQKCRKECLPVWSRLICTRKVFYSPPPLKDFYVKRLFDYREWVGKRYSLLLKKTFILDSEGAETNGLEIPVT